MFINTVSLINGAKVLLLDQVFEADMLSKLHRLCDEFSTDNPDWQTPDWTTYRYVYQGHAAVYQELQQYLGSESVTAQITQAIDKSHVVLSTITLWIDFPGVGPLSPHVEGDDSYLAQIYITKTPHSYSGTTVYQQDKKVLFQLPYRDNFGWFFDRATQVMHGREHDVPNGISRFSIMAWYV